MTPKEIQAHVNYSATRLLELGLSRPEVLLQFRSDSMLFVSVRYYDEQGRYQSEANFCDDVFTAQDWINRTISKIPPRADRERAIYLSHIAAAIEYGKKIGIDEEFINPLALQMKKLSSNIVEYKPSEETPF